MSAAVAALAKRLNRLKELRQPHEQVWRDCFDHSFPIRGSGLEGGAPLSAQSAMDRKAETVRLGPEVLIEARRCYHMRARRSLGR